VAGDGVAAAEGDVVIGVVTGAGTTGAAIGADWAIPELVLLVVVITGAVGAGAIAVAPPEPPGPPVEVDTGVPAPTYEGGVAADVGLELLTVVVVGVVAFAGAAAGVVAFTADPLEPGALINMPCLVKFVSLTAFSFAARLEIFDAVLPSIAAPFWIASSSGAAGVPAVDELPLVTGVVVLPELGVPRSEPLVVVGVVVWVGVWVGVGVGVVVDVVPSH
jgi:hypothetical protein